MAEGQSGGVNISGISGGSISIGGDVAGRDMFKGNIVSGNAALGEGASVTATQTTGAGPDLKELLARWKAEMEAAIEAQANLAPEDKSDIKDQVAKIEAEAQKQAETVAAGAEPETGRLEKLINTLAVMGPDIWEVATTTLTNPLSGLGLVLKKIGEKARLERQAAAT